MYTRTNLVHYFQKAKEKNSKYIYIVIKNKNHNKNEIIINPMGNVEDKTSYIENAYNEDLTLKACKDIKIVDFGSADDFYDIEKNLEFTNVI